MYKILVVLGLFIASVSDLSPDALYPEEIEYLRSIRVEVIVDKTVGMSASTVKGLLYRELRKLPDVEIVTDNPHWQLRIHVAQTHTQNGLPVGYAYAVVVSLKVPCPTQNSDVFNLATYFLGVSPSDELELTLSEVVLGLDADYFEPHRQVKDNLIDR